MDLFNLVLTILMVGLLTAILTYSFAMVIYLHISNKKLDSEKLLQIFDKCAKTGITSGVIAICITIVTMVVL